MPDASSPTTQNTNLEMKFTRKQKCLFWCHCLLSRCSKTILSTRWTVTLTARPLTSGRHPVLLASAAPASGPCLEPEAPAGLSVSHARVRHSDFQNWSQQHPLRNPSPYYLRSGSRGDGESEQIARTPCSHGHNQGQEIRAVVRDCNHQLCLRILYLSMMSWCLLHAVSRSSFECMYLPKFLLYLHQSHLSLGAPCNSRMVVSI